MKPGSPKVEFHQLMNLLRDIFTNNARLRAGIVDVKMTFTGKEKERIRYRLKKNSPIKNIGTKNPQKIPPALSKRSVPGTFKINL